MFTDISLPFESVGTTKKSNSGSIYFDSQNPSKIRTESSVRAESSGPLIGGLSQKNSRTNQGIYNGLGINLRDCLSAFMSEEELQQDVECQTCSWAATLQSFENKSSSTSLNLTSKFVGQAEEERLNELILQQFRTAMPKGKLDSCSLDLDDVLFPSVSDIDDSSSVADSVSVRSCNNVYSTWRMRNCLGAVAELQEKSTKLDPYLVRKVRTRTRKQLILSRPPPLLCLHICRRVADAVTGRMKKLNHHVSFPGILDINDYINTYRGSIKSQDIKAASVGGIFTTHTNTHTSASSGFSFSPRSTADSSTDPSPMPSPTANHIPGILPSFGSGSTSSFGTVHGKKRGSGPNEYLLRSVIVHTGSSEAGKSFFLVLYSLSLYLPTLL